MWDKVKKAFAKSQKNLKIENTARKTFELGMCGVISKNNAVEELLAQHSRATSSIVKSKIVNRLKTIWKK